MTKRVIIWGVYRTLSSALSRSFLQRADTEVIFEPFSGAFYLGPEV